METQRNREMEEMFSGQKVQTSGYKTTKFREYNIQHGNYS